MACRVSFTLLAQMVVSRLDGFRRIICPAAVLARIPYAGGEFRVLRHPVFPIGGEKVPQPLASSLRLRGILAVRLFARMPTSQGPASQSKAQRKKGTQLPRLHGISWWEIEF